MNYWIETLIATILIIGILSGIVYIRNRHRPPNRRFLVFATGLMLWSCVDILLMSLKDVIHLLFLLKMAGILGALLPAAFIFFAVGFEIPESGEETKRLKKIQMSFFVLAVIASLFTLHPSFIRQIHISENLQGILPGPDVDYGWPFIIYSLIIICTMFFGLRYFYRLMRRKKGIQRTEIQYIFLAIISGTVFAVVSTLIAPMLGTTILCRFGSMSSILMASIIAYAIAKHRIMNISFVAEKIFVYACLCVALFLIYIFSFTFIEHLLKIFIPQKTLLPTIVSAFIVAIIFNPLKDIIGKWAKVKIFRQEYDIESILQQMRLVTSSALSLEEGITAMLEILRNETNITGKPVFLVNSEQGTIKSFSTLSSSSVQIIKTDAESSIMKLFESEPTIYFKDEILRFSSRTIIGRAIKEMESYNAEVAIPVFIHNRFAGIFLAGGKQGQIPFNERDRRIFNAFSFYLGIFIESNQLLNTLRENRIYQQSLLENLPDGVIAVNEKGDIIVFNRMAEIITGLSKQDVLEKNYEKVVPLPFNKLLNDLLNHNIEIKNMEVELARNGKHIPLRTSGSKFFSFNGSLLGAQLIFSDISQLKTLQRHLERNERLASLGILAGGIAHEIRNPLVAMKTFSQLLPEKFQDEEFRTNYLKVVIPEIERINQLVEQLLAFAKPRPPRMEEVEILSIIQATTMLISAQEKFKNIKISLNSNMDTIKIQADPEKMKQALLNILLNSAEAIDNRAGEIMISIKKDTEKIIIEIKDNGTGIKPEIMDKIFDPLFTTKPHGTGLGLTIVNEIIAQHNGRILIESEYGMGTKVFIEIPINSGANR